MYKTSPSDTALLRESVAHQVAGHVALDFCNTAGEHLAQQPDEKLNDWETFVRWSAQVALIDPASYRALAENPLPMHPVIQLRESIYRVGLALARKEPVRSGDLDFIRKQASTPKPAIANSPHGLRWRPDPARSSAQLRSVLASEALSLFCSPRAARIGVCNGGLCGWLFLDESRGKRRRWCDMNDCGSRAKANRYYARHKNS